LPAVVEDRLPIIRMTQPVVIAQALTGWFVSLT
jgi:hypothetical protein